MVLDRSGTVQYIDRIIPRLLDWVYIQTEVSQILDNAVLSGELAAENRWYYSHHVIPKSWVF